MYEVGVKELPRVTRGGTALAEERVVVLIYFEVRVH